MQLILGKPHLCLHLTGYSYVTQRGTSPLPHVLPDTHNAKVCVNASPSCREYNLADYKNISPTLFCHYSLLNEEGPPHELYRPSWNHNDTAQQITSLFQDYLPD